MKNVNLLLLSLCCCIMYSCKKDTVINASEPVTVIKATGDIQDEVDAFRTMLGPLNTVPDATGGRREINWDGLPDSLENKALPPDLFNPVDNKASASMQRGIVYSTGGKFMVSSDGFAAVNNAAAPQFAAFSGTKTFANTGAAQWETTFQKAGTSQSASVQAFGLVFSDVDKDNSASLEFFNEDKSIGKYFVPAHSAAGSFSFLGVRFNNGERITKVLVSHDGFLSEDVDDISNGGTNDLVVVDDFIFSEPVAQ